MVAILRFVVLIPSMNLSFDFTCSENQAIVTFESVDIARDVKELFDKGYGNPFLFMQSIVMSIEWTIANLMYYRSIYVRVMELSQCDL